MTRTTRELRTEFVSDYRTGKLESLDVGRLSFVAISRLAESPANNMIPAARPWCHRFASRAGDGEVTDSHRVEMDGSRFWVIHRRRKYGPFDYEWSSDFRGVELLYDGTKFGEYCSLEELFADLKPFGLPMSVVSVTSIVMGCVLFGVFHGLRDAERRELVTLRLREHGFDRFSLT